MASCLSLLMTFAVCLACCQAGTFYVNNEAGDDAWDGSSRIDETEGKGPFKTIARALKLAQAGDTIELDPNGRPYEEEIILKDKGGEPGKPITVEGRGAVLDGSEPIASDRWERVDGDLWRVRGLTSRNGLIVNDRAVIERKLSEELLPGEFCVESGQFEPSLLFFMPPLKRKLEDCSIQVVWPDGETIHAEPRHWYVGSSLNYKLKRKDRPDHVLLDGVKIVPLDPRPRLKEGEWCLFGQDLYYRCPAGKGPSAMNLRRIVRGTGVSLSGSLGHVIIKNLNVRFVWNDAYNVHGKVVDAVFINCNARDCFDEGFSAHGECETTLDGALFERCDNGVFNVNKAGWSVTKNITVRHSRHFGFGVAVVDSEARHWVSNAILEENPTPFTGRYLEADNVLVRSSQSAEIPVGGPISLRNVTVLAKTITWEIVHDGPVNMRDSVFLSDGEQKIIFTKSAKVSLDAVSWSAGTKIFLTKESSLTLDQWLQQLGPRATKSGNLGQPKGIGYKAGPVGP